MTWSLGRLLRSLIYGFQRDFRPYEQVAIDAALSVLPAVDRERIEEHIEVRERLQRSNSDRVVIIDIQRRNDCQAVDGPDGEYVCAAVVLVGAAAQVEARLVLYRGVLHTLEFSRPPELIGAATPSVVSVRRNPGGGGYTLGIDAEEHGTTRGDA